MTSRQSRGESPFLRNRTTRGRLDPASTISGLSNALRIIFQEPVSLFDAVTMSNVHFTSSAVTGRPSDHLARSSM